MAPFGVFRKFLLGAPVGAALFALISCSSSHLNEPQPLQPIDSSLPVQRVWLQLQLNLAEGAGDTIAPFVDDQALYWVDPYGVATARSLADGRVIWRKALGIVPSSAVGGGDGVVIFSSHKAEVIAVDAQTGAERWRATTTSEVLAPPQVGEGAAVVHTVDGKIVAFDAQSGHLKWRFDHAVPLLTLHARSAPVIADDQVFAGLSNGKLVALELATGKAKWQAVVAEARGRTELERMVDVAATPLVLGDRVYLAGYQGRVAAASTVTGRFFWSRDISTAQPMAYDGDSLYVTTDTGEVVAVSRRAGEIAWRQSALSHRSTTAPVTFGDYLIVGDGEGYLHWLDRSTGKFVHRMRIDTFPIEFAPVVKDNTLYVITRGGVIDALTVTKPAVVGEPG